MSSIFQSMPETYSVGLTVIRGTGGKLDGCA
jgi:hypothetical protein